MKIALTGGIACGKSTFAKFLKELGICLLDADDVVHELEAADGAAVPAIVERFGHAVLAADGSIDRRALADVVFFDSDARRDLESILFPLVRARLNAFCSCAKSGRVGTPCRPSSALKSDLCARSARSADPTNHQSRITNHEFRIAIIPLLFESHWESDYDTIITIASSVERQIERMMLTRGYSRKQAKARLAAQLPIVEKVRRADYVVVNDSTPKHLSDEAMRLLAWLKERKKYEH